MMLALFYLSLIVTIGTIFIVAIKGFLELMAPVRAAKLAAQDKK